ncbi:MAG: FliI/YscN family ATPase [Sandaracinus sp.]
MSLDLSRFSAALKNVDPVSTEGRVTGAVGLALRAIAPGARLGAIAEITRSTGSEDVGGTVLAEVVAFDGEIATMLPLGTATGIGPGDRVSISAHGLTVRAGDDLLGRVLDGLGEPIDGGPPLRGEPVPVLRAPPSPLERPRVTRLLPLGVRVLDALTPVGEGQRLGLFSGSGVGKSTLLAQIARQAAADVFVVCLVGERGREVVEFLEDGLGPEGRARGVVVAATSDAPPLVRMRSAFVATAIAEHFRDQGASVLLLVDSVTRFARAAREVGLAAGEPPARRGYPPSVFAQLPQLLERSGTSPRGAITGIYTVLVEGSDLEEPIADEVRGILDGHVVLSRALASRGRFPAVDPRESLSRLGPRIASPAHLAAAAKLREHVSIYEEKRDLVLLGAYKRGGDAALDRALDRMEAIEGFLRQSDQESAALEATLAALARVV